jgi:hypothetical protein
VIKERKVGKRNFEVEIPRGREKFGESKQNAK